MIQVFPFTFADNLSMDGDPNVNLFPLESAENSVAQAVRSLNVIVTTNDPQAELKRECLAVLRELQQTSLFALRVVVEG